MVPISGPNSVPTPPMMAMKISSPERAQLIMSGLMKPAKLPSSMPATLHSMADST